MPPAVRRPRRRGTGWLVALVILAVLLFAADRITVLIAEHVAADKIKSSQQLDHTPSVTVRGFPFLTQLISGTINQVDVTAKDFVAGEAGQTIRIRSLKVQLHRVHISGFSSARAQTATASASIDYSALSAVLGVPVRYGGATADGLGRVATDSSATVLGQSFSGTASAEIKVRGSNVLQFVNPAATVNGATVPPTVLTELTRAFDRSISLHGLPFQLTLQSVRASAGGVTVVATASNVTYQ
ncbi:MAG TPA: DUF2993 domain-containing protein [Jatrophihabitantaceae bacterium]